MEKTLRDLDYKNQKLVEIMINNRIGRLDLISCGNSIATGYSMNSISKPLLYRNESIKNKFIKNGIILNRYHFCRAEDNNDEHIFSYLVNNTTLGEINKLNRFDVPNMNFQGINQENLEEYYPLNDNTTLNSLFSKDSIENNNGTASSVVVYNGVTGSFLDNVTRGGKHFFTYGVKRDCTSIEAFLKYIQELNRKQNKGIQVYLCGAPKLLGLSDLFMNTRLKKIAKNYANVVYVENIPKKLIYKKEDGSITFDLHYNIKEYLELNDKIIGTINDNYTKTRVIIELDKKLYELNTNYQLGIVSNNNISTEVDLIISQVVSKYKSSLVKDNVNIKEMLKDIRTYLINRVPYDFYYVGKKQIKTKLR